MVFTFLPSNQRFGPAPVSAITPQRLSGRIDCLSANWYPALRAHPGLLGAELRLRPVAAETSCSNGKASVPSWRSTIGRRMDRFDACPTARKDPGDNRVRVPHLPRAELVTAPYGRRYRWQCVEDSFRNLDIVGHPDRASDRLIDVGNGASSPAPNLVAEDPESPEPSHSDGTLRYHTSPFAMQIRYRRLLDHEVTFWRGDDERRMVEITPRTTGNESCRRLKELPADPNDVRSGAQRDPVQVDSRLASDRRLRVAKQALRLHSLIAHAARSECVMPTVGATQNAAEKSAANGALPRDARSAPEESVSLGGQPMHNASL